MAEKKTSKKTTKPKKEQQFTLYDLVKDSSFPFYLIKPALIMNDLFTQFIKEEEKIKNGGKVNVSLTKDEFNKLINEYKERKI